MEWLDQLFQVVGLWGFLASAFAAGVALGIKYGLKNINITIRKS